jgi:hypothetical protein
VIGVVTHWEAHLGRQDDVVPTPLERLPDDDLGFAPRVRIGGVDEVDPGVERLVDHPAGVVVVGVAARRPEHERAKPIGADLDPGPAECAVLHGVLSGS